MRLTGTHLKPRCEGLQMGFHGQLTADRLGEFDIPDIAEL